jgi:hypothetical protein
LTASTSRRSLAKLVEVRLNLFLTFVYEVSGLANAAEERLPLPLI